MPSLSKKKGVKQNSMSRAPSEAFIDEGTSSAKKKTTPLLIYMYVKMEEAKIKKLDKTQLKAMKMLYHNTFNPTLEKNLVQEGFVSF